MNPLQLSAFCTEHGFPLTAAQIAAFAEFEEALYEANLHMNLTRVAREDCVLRHFVDSLLIAPLIPQGATVLDVGCGPGFPAWPLACARPDLLVNALDSSGKMIGFLQRHPLPNLRATLGRAEETGWREAFDFVTGRAVSPLAIQLELSAAPCALKGPVVPFRTPNNQQEIERFDPSRLGLRLREVRHAELPGTDVVRIFPVYEKVRATPEQYPRTWAQIRKLPLQ